MESFASYLDLAIKAARAAGDLLRVDFHRPAGPRGEYDKSPADTEAEQIIQNILLSGEGEWGFLGEETERIPGAKGAPIWVVDPNDGTRDYIKGRRGSSVSIALVWDRRPVLGVVHPFGYPDDDGQVYSAAVGREGVWKDGGPVSSSLPQTLTALDVVLISGGGDRAARANLECARPARVMTIPSIAHRLARVASGEASAACSLYSPKTWDFAAGHCLILAAGGVIVDRNGNELVYQEDASGTALRLFAGSRPVALELSSRDWDPAFRSVRESSTQIVRLAKGGGVRNPPLLARAQGAVLGHLVGSSLGSLFSGPDAVGVKDPLSLLSIETAASRHRLLAGQPGSSGELAIAVSRSLIDLASDRKSLNRVYADWVASSPAELDRAIESAVKGEALAENLSAMALARITPLAIWGHAADPLIVATTARSDTALTHPAPICGDAAAVLSLIMQALVQGRNPSEAVAEGHAFARRTGLAREVIAAIVESSEPSESLRSERETPSVLRALQVTLFHLTQSRSFEDGLQGALALGSHSDVLPALVGAAVGARFGREAITQRLRNLVLSCRPMEGLATSPRPSTYWGADAMAMAEALLTSR